MKATDTSVAQRYDRALRYARHHHLPPDYPVPQPTAAWPPENITLLEDYRNWLLSGGASPYTVNIIYLPMAGHVLGLSLKPHDQLDLETDLVPAMDYILAKQLSVHWTKVSRNALDKFRRFLRQQRGHTEVMAALPEQSYYHGLYCAGLPDWLVEALTRYQHLRQPNWRPARLHQQLIRFWHGHTDLWRWLFAHYAIPQPLEVKRKHIFAYQDERLANGAAVSSINHHLRCFQASLRFLQEQDYAVPQALLRLPGLKQPDRLPRFLTDEQVACLRDDIEQRVVQASSAPQHRNALLDRAAFYLLWQGGLRLGEVEELRLDDLDLTRRKLTVRDGKGRKDRTVYLTRTIVRALQAYLAVRGMGPTDHVFLYRNRAIRKDLLHSRIRDAGRRVGVKVSPHRLRHTCATQLLNAGCRVTSIQKLLGHRRLNSTMLYARVHNRTVAEDYYTAMARIEGRLNLVPDDDRPASAPVLGLIDRLQADPLTERQQAAVAGLQAFILTLAEPATTGIPVELPLSVA
ncbi:MAG: tyrosine-type recombinase/integrase [Anaerolineae bacterium]